MLCVVCQAVMKPLLNGFYCPKDCDRQPITLAVAEPNPGMKLPEPPTCWPNAKVYVNAGASVATPSNLTRFTKDGDELLFYSNGSGPLIHTGWLNPVYWLYVVKSGQLITIAGHLVHLGNFPEENYPYFAVKQ